MVDILITIFGLNANSQIYKHFGKIHYVYGLSYFLRNCIKEGLHRTESQYLTLLTFPFGIFGPDSPEHTASHPSSHPNRGGSLEPIYPRQQFIPHNSLLSPNILVLDHSSFRNYCLTDDTAASCVNGCFAKV